MKAICVDDEYLVLQLTVSMCKKLPQLDDVRGFTRANSAIEAIKQEPVQLAILDIDMPDMNGIELAMAIKEVNPDIRILFVTGYTEYAVEAFKIHASGYLLKPVSQEQLENEVAHALEGVKDTKTAHIFARTFGNFDLFVDGKPVSFGRTKARELLAFLIDRQGAQISRKTIFGSMWEEGMYDRPMQKQLDVIIRSLKSTLEECGIPEILEMQYGMLRVVPEAFECDLYKFFSGDVDAINSFHGEYMSDYSWASLTEAYMYRFANKKGS